jgi:rhodanese-related sulfurtransferase
MTGGEGDGGGTTPWPRDELTAALLAELPGLEIVRMIIAHPEWVHRRVDFIDYRDDTTFRRRQSIHFTVPAAAPEIRVSEARFRLIPLTTLNKATLVNFNCRDEADSALPILTRRQQGLLIVRGMTAWAEAVVGAPLADDVAAEIDGRLTGQEGTRETARAAFDSGGGQRAVLRDDDIFALVLERLTDQFLLTTLVTDPPGTQRIVKFSCEELNELAPEPWPRTPLAALCWIPRRAASAAEGLFSAESYHFEADLPHGVDVPVATLWAGSGDDDLTCIDVDPGDHLRIALRSRGLERGVAEVRWSLRPARRGWLRAAWFATVTAAVTLGVGAWRLDTLVAGTPLDGSVAPDTRTQLGAAVILTVVGALGGLVARIEEHPLVTRLLAWPRRLAVLAAILPFAAAGTLVVGPAGEARRAIWITLAVVAGVIAATFTVAFLVRPTTEVDRPPTPPSQD